MTTLSTPHPSAPAALSPGGRFAALAICALAVCAASGCSKARTFSPFAKAPEPPVADLAEQPSAAAMAATDPARPSAVSELIDRGDQALMRHQAAIDPAERQRALGEAKRHYTAAIADQPQNATAHHRAAVCFDLAEDFAQAESHYRVAIAQSGETAELVSDLGLSYLLQKRYDEAETYLTRARELDPTYDRAIGNLALLYAATGDRERCLAMCRLTTDEQTAIDKVAELFASQDETESVAPPKARLARDDSGIESQMRDELDRLRQEIAQLRSGERTAEASTSFGGSPQPFAAAADDPDPTTTAETDGGFQSFMAAGEPTAPAKRFETLPAPSAAGEPLVDAPPKTQRTSGEPSVDARREAALIGLSTGTGGGWALLATADMRGTAPAAAMPGAGAMPTITPMPTIEPLSPSPSAVAEPVPPPASTAPLAEATFGARTYRTGFADPAVVEPTQYDPGATQAGFGAGAAPDSGPPAGPVIGAMQPIPPSTKPAAGLPVIQPGNSYAPPPTIRPAGF